MDMGLSSPRGKLSYAGMCKLGKNSNYFSDIYYMLKNIY